MSSPPPLTRADLAFGDNICGNILTCFDASAVPAGVLGLVRAANIMVLIHMIPAYQVFSQPFFYFVEHFVRKRVFPKSAGKAGGLTFRIIFRSLYVVVVCFVAICLPFFGDFVGLVRGLRVQRGLRSA